jgi:hypothetical protein
MGPSGFIETGVPRRVKDHRNAPDVIAGIPHPLHGWEGASERGDGVAVAPAVAVAGDRQRGNACRSRRSPLLGADRAGEIAEVVDRQPKVGVRDSALSAKLLPQ